MYVPPSTVLADEVAMAAGLAARKVFVVTTLVANSL